MSEADGNAFALTSWQFPGREFCRKLMRRVSVSFGGDRGTLSHCILRPPPSPLELQPMEALDCPTSKKEIGHNPVFYPCG